jgi:Helix-hairpin-helix motif
MSDRHLGRTIAGHVWAPLPFLSAGMLTPLVIGYAAARLRSRLQALATALYTALVTVMFILVEAEPGSAGEFVFWACMAGLAFGGTTHAYWIRRSVFGGARPNSLEAARGRAEHQRLLREQARRIVRDEPDIALELGIGRPDLVREFDDGGVVDVNRAPVAALLHLPDVTPEMAERIVAVRERAGGFVSAEEMCALADLPPHLTPRLAEYAVFLP